jgi:hypothetical protein
LAVATKTLVDKIEALPPERRAKVEDFVDSMAEAVATATEPTFPRELLERINARREELLHAHGLFPDSTDVIRELREEGQ